MTRILLFALLAGPVAQLTAQNLTDASLFMRADSGTYLDEVSSESGDLYTKVGHHGPAVENQWMGLRIYFDHKCAIDVYNKTRPGLELKEGRWYPTVRQQNEGWGADYYKVGSTVGLGGVRLWDGEKVVELDPVTQRIARVHKDEHSSWMEMISEGVPYKDRKVDILIRVTVYSDSRLAKVEALQVKGGPVQFVTGINYHPGGKLEKRDGMIATWALHPEDVAAEKVSLGGAIFYDTEHFRKQVDDGSQVLLIADGCRSMTTWIASACAKEPELNNMDSFLEFLELAGKEIAW